MLYIVISSKAYVAIYFPQLIIPYLPSRQSSAVTTNQAISTFLISTYSASCFGTSTLSTPSSSFALMPSTST